MLKKLERGVLESGAANGIEKIAEVSKEERPHIIIKMRRCESCQDNDFEISATVVWQEEKTQGDKIKVEDKKSEWFDTMLSAKLGIQVEKAIFAYPLSRGRWI